MPCEATSPAASPRAEPRRWLRRLGIALYRLGVLAAAFLALAARPSKMPHADREALLAVARAEVPGSSALGNPIDGFFPLQDGKGEQVGWITSTYPQAAQIQGYAGPSELWVIFNMARRVRAAGLLSSADTTGHVAKVRESASFWEQWNGRDESNLATAAKPRIVSGATLTSEAMSRGIAARFGAIGMDEWFPQPLTVDDAARWFPDAERLEPRRQAGTLLVMAGGRQIGTVLRSSRMGVNARGYNGPSDVIVALDGAGERIIGLALWGSRDNEPYVGDVKDELLYTRSFSGQSVADVIGDDSRPGLIASGASMTASAVTTTVREMLRRHTAEHSSAGIPWTGVAALAWIGTGIVLAFSRLGRRPAVRTAFALASVAAGLTLGLLLGQDQVIGWARHGMDLRKVWPLAALTIAALLVPAFTGKNVYCSRLCPHGAAQSIAGLTTRKRFALPARWHHALRRAPWLLLIAIWTVAFAGLDLPFANAEPFEAWSSGFRAVLPAVLFTGGLLAAFFVPQAYCHYGCPTGALLTFLTHSPARFTRRDGIAGLLVCAAWGIVLLR